jgi:hypothetical protein
MTDSTDNARGPERIWAWPWATSETKGQWAVINKGDVVMQVTEYRRADLAPAPLDARVAELVDALEAWLELAAHCSIEEGVCCCGDNMENHSDPMFCGHSPVDHGAYIAMQLIESTRAALAAFDKGGKDE